MRNPSPDHRLNTPRGNDGQVVAAITGAIDAIDNTSLHLDHAHSPLELPSHEVLAQLARDDPQAYEAYRRQIVESFIDSAPERLKSRLSGIQFRVDSVRQLSRASALGATVRVYELMWKSFQHLNEVWQDFMPTENGRGNFCDSRYSKAPAKKHMAKQEARILAFRQHLHCDQ
jgi:hypothetical protein